MANRIANRVELIGNDSDIKNVFTKYYTEASEQPLTYLGNVVYVKERETGIYIKKTNEFRFYDGTIVCGIPDGFKIMMEEFLPDPLDFNKILPLPEELQLAYDNCDLEMDAQSSIEFWQRENWGTGEGATSFEKITDSIFQFETLWNAVPKVIQAISQDFPELVIIYEVVDEYVSEIIAKFIFTQGKQIAEVHYDSDSKEATELELKLFPNDYQYFKISDGNLTRKNQQEIFDDFKLLLEKRAS